MADSITLALDVMGGDHAPNAVLEGAVLALKRYPKLSFLLFGDEETIKPALIRFPLLKKASQLVHTSEKIANTEKPTLALRRKNTSLRLAVQAVADKKAAGIISSGNTGAYMALAKIMLGTIPGILRPAIATSFPTQVGSSVMLDMGANIQCDAEHLVQFAVMGSVYAQEVLHKERPTVGLLNVGSEEVKGHATLQQAAALLREMQDVVQFEGYIEGDDITGGKVDVVVTDGFTGNICIKTAEGMSRMIYRFYKNSMKHSISAKLGFLLSIPALKKIKAQLDPVRYNGAMFIGLNGVAIKSHGGANAKAFANAISVATQMISHDFNHHIEEDLKKIQEIVA